MSSTRRALVMAVVAGGIMLAGCGDSPPESQVAPAAKTGKAPKVAGLRPDMVAAVSAERSASVISVHFALAKPPVIGQALPVDIAIVPHQDFTSVRAYFDGGDGLSVTVGNEMQPVTNVKMEAVLEHQLVLLPAREGVYLISATVESESPTEGTVSRVFSLPMIVSAPGASPPAPAAAPPAAAPAQ
jgi:outer membrane murein-binding lipoprotein Lpp